MLLRARVSRSLLRSVSASLLRSDISHRSTPRETRFFSSLSIFSFVLFFGRRAPSFGALHHACGLIQDVFPHPSSPLARARARTPLAIGPSTAQRHRPLSSLVLQRAVCVPRLTSPRRGFSCVSARASDPLSSFSFPHTRERRNPREDDVTTAHLHT